MCGISGIFSIKGVSTGILNNISQKLRHRGPDDEGYYVVDFTGQAMTLKGNDTIYELNHLKSLREYKGKIKLALIHRRLSIIDLKHTGHQPMASPEEDLWIIFNGEIYNYLELREELINLGYLFHTESDTEIILAAYKEWSENCVDHFLGMWSFVIYDLSKEILFCSRDRFGIKPFYYFKDNGIFVFASEIKAILEVPGINARLQVNNAIEFLSYGNQNFSGETIFQNINELPAGHNLIYNLRNQIIEIKQYYKLLITNKYNNISLDDAVEELQRLIFDSIKIHLRSDVPVGSCLSGGLDSSTIIACLEKQNLKSPIHTFTASFPGQTIDESIYVEELKKLYKISDHYTFPEPRKLWEDIDQLLWHQDLPVQSTSPYAQWEVMSLAHKNNIKVLLDGQGIDEILGGYSEFIGAHLLGKISSGHLINFFINLKDLKLNYKTSSVLNELSRASFQIIPQFLKSRIYSVNRLGPTIINEKYSENVRGIKFEKRISNSVRKTSLLSIENILPSLLRYEDRNSMAFSIESRVPFLDHRLVEFCVNIPDEMKIHKGWTKYILRKASEEYLPSEITWRKEKLGFVTPELTWTKTLLNEMQATIKNSEVPKIIDRNKFLKSLNSNINNKINLGELWKIFLFIRWANIFDINDE